MCKAKKICLILFLNYFVLSKCSLPSANIETMDNKIIQRKRLDTLELCKLFKAQTESHFTPPVKRSKRVKRENDIDGIGDPNDLQRVEQIVEKMYDDINENQTVKVTYKRRFNVIKQSTLPSLQNRRLDFAPSTMDIEGEDHDATEAPFIPPSTSDGSDTGSKQWMGPYTNWHKKWIHGIVPYYIDPATYDFNFQNQIDEALEFFEKSTCIRLQKLQNKPTDTASFEKVDWIYITNPTGIYQCVHSNEEKEKKGVQMVILGYDCLSLGEIAHEVMHILGFSHEHTRPDRNAHITINWHNIKEGYKKYFQLRKDDPFSDIPYDYTSVLHYPPRAFSKNGKPTIVPKIEHKLGQRLGLSQGDVEKVNLVFGNQCIERNTQYLSKTCPIVLEDQPKVEKISKADIDEHFRHRKWDDNIVNYSIKNRIEFTEDELDKISSAMREISGCTKITFENSTDIGQSLEDKEDGITPEEHPMVNPIERRHETDDDDIAELMISRGTQPGCPCPAPGSRELVINADCFKSKRSLLHLFLHVLGLDHQHNMHDRDSYLKIEWNLLTPELTKELSRKLPPIESLGLPYDYQSVMHLPWLTIENGVQNIIYPVWNDGWSMGNADKLSVTDVKKLNMIYD